MDDGDARVLCRRYLLIIEIVSSEIKMYGTVELFFNLQYN